MKIQQLENRVLLASFASLNSNGTLSIVGNSSPNQLEVKIQNNSVVAMRDGQMLSFAKSKVKRIWMYGVNGDDVLRNSTSLPSTLLGGRGSDTIFGGAAKDDTVQFNDGSNDCNIDITVAADGTVTAKGLIYGKFDDVSGCEKFQAPDLPTRWTVKGSVDAPDLAMCPTLMGGAKEDVYQVYGNANVVLSGGKGHDGYYFFATAPGLARATDEIIETDNGVSDGLVIGGAIGGVINLENPTAILVQTGRVVKATQATIDRIEGLQGGEGDDYIRGNGSVNTLNGNEGNDTLVGGAGDDRIEDDYGANLILGGDGNDVLSSEGNASTLNGGDGNDVAYAYGENSLLFGGAGNDKLGGHGGCTLFGEGGDDVLFTAFGEQDFLDGGEGYDTATTDSDVDVTISVELVNGQPTT